MPRKKPFSSKGKRIQLLEHRQKKSSKDSLIENDDKILSLVTPGVDKPAIYSDGTINKVSDPNRYNLQFAKDSDEDIRRSLQDACTPFCFLGKEALEFSIRDFFPDLPTFSIPVRPSWSYEDARESVEGREEAYFSDFSHTLLSSFGDKNLSLFELNLETWRQFWRVIEYSDIVVVVTDIRYASLLFPPALFEYVTKSLKKEIILILNKFDYIPPSLSAAWIDYFEKEFPNLHVLPFSCQIDVDEYRTLTESRREIDSYMHKQRKIIKKKDERRADGYRMVRSVSYGRLLFYECCQRIVGNTIDITDWRRRIELQEQNDRNEFTCVSPAQLVLESEAAANVGVLPRPFCQNNELTLGFVGYPNVGKSSVLNCLVGEKVVSVSKTPGHTKHFQTIYLTSNVKLCDCPGLVFPSLAPKPLQILANIFPIAQVREPFSCIRYMTERMNLIKVLNMPQLPENPVELCEFWAEKRGFHTAKAARSDIHRAANHILRLQQEGRIRFCLRPPNYLSRRQFWESSEETRCLIRAVAQVGQPSSKKTSDPGQQLTSSEDEQQIDDPSDSLSAEDENCRTNRTSACRTTNMFGALDDSNSD